MLTHTERHALLLRSSKLQYEVDQERYYSVNAALPFNEVLYKKLIELCDETLVAIDECDAEFIRQSVIRVTALELLPRLIYTCSMFALIKHQHTLPAHAHALFTRQLRVADKFQVLLSGLRVIQRNVNEVG